MNKQIRRHERGCWSGKAPPDTQDCRALVQIRQTPSMSDFDPGIFPGWKDVPNLTWGMDQE